MQTKRTEKRRNKETEYWGQDFGFCVPGKFGQY